MSDNNTRPNAPLLRYRDTGEAMYLSSIDSTYPATVFRWNHFTIAPYCPPIREMRREWLRRSFLMYRDKGCTRRNALSRAVYDLSRIPNP